jgi:hypothetical protein
MGLRSVLVRLKEDSGIDFCAHALRSIECSESSWDGGQLSLILSGSRLVINLDKRVVCWQYIGYQS